MENAHSASVDQVLTHFETDATHGLTHTQVQSQREKHGENSLPEEQGASLFTLIVEQFQDELVQILLLAAVISFVLALFEEQGESAVSAFVEPCVILLILIANATVGVIQETNAEKAIEALKRYAPDEAKVIRHGHLQKVQAKELVPGDLCELAVGDKVPADLRLIEILSSAFRVDQALFTGESVSVHKSVDVVRDKRAVKQDQINLLFSGTTVVLGKARAIVVQTGRHTAMGEIQKNISEQETEKTPLKKKLDEFGDQLAKVITVICVLVWLVNIHHFSDPAHGGVLKGAIYYFKIAVALAVAAIPEGLAVVITTCLALGTKRMAAKNAIVRTLPSVETLGCTSVICSDKTGTLTTNQMSVRRVVLLSSANHLKEYTVTGSGFAPIGQVLDDDENVAQVTPALQELATICSLCNDASLVYDETHSHQPYRNVGEPTEAALKVFVEKLGVGDESFDETLSELLPSDRVNACDQYWQERYTKSATLDFNRDRKSMSVYCHAVNHGNSTKKKSTVKNTNIPGLLFVKGAPEAILERSVQARLFDGSVVKMSASLRASIQKTFQSYGEKEALRVLAFATRDVAPLLNEMDLSDASLYASYESGLTFIGLVAMMDPPREEVKEAIRQCHQAGIRVIVMTGDHQHTAESICRSIGVFQPDEDLTGKSFTGREWDDLNESERRHVLRTASLFSRTEPSHKSQLVDLLQAQGHVVAMTGDGVNDAPALKKADIGVAMGSGTDVAKLAADMVLSDDNFSSIVSAVEEGRAIYSNTKQFIRYLISSNIGEVVSIFLTVLLGMPEALIPVQLLWVNLVTDGLPATALGFNPHDHEIMRHPPRAKTEPIVDGWLFLRYLLVGIYVGVATVAGYAWWFMYYNQGPRITFYQLTHFHLCSTTFPELGCDMFYNTMAHRASTMSLSILVTIEMFNAMNSLSENESLLTLPFWTNIYLVLAIALSMALHFMILYVPFFSQIFSITPLNYEEWQAVILFSLPVLLLDEILKAISRWIIVPARDKKRLEEELAVTNEGDEKEEKKTKKRASSKKRQ